MVHTALNINEHSLLRYVDFNGPDAEQKVARLAQPDGARGGMGEFWLTAFLLLANYTSMNATLIDHCRALMSKYKDTEFALQDEQRRAPLVTAPVGRFIKDLRNVIVHQSAPPLEFEVRVQDGHLTRSAKLNSAAMLTNERFTAGAKEYLSGKESIVITEAVTEYAALREDYYGWLFDQFEDVHEAELTELDQLRQEYLRVSGLDGGGLEPVHFARMTNRAGNDVGAVVVTDVRVLDDEDPDHRDDGSRAGESP
ncbi:hypothetical protein D7252_12980 [Microbacterium sp. CGR2]|nr:hypothetical protein D7252_12980 [Microbacterium sp. CGR2]